MTKAIYYNLDHAMDRLRGTLVRYKGEPAYIREVEPAGKGEFIIIADLTSHVERVQDKLSNFDLSPVPVGNVMVEDRYQFATRTPVRRWKQGLAENHLHLYQMPWGRMGDINVRSQNLANAILGKYSRFDDAYDKVKGGQAFAVPISRSFGIGRHKDGHIILINRHKEVGWADDQGVYIDKRKFFLQEELLGVLNGKV